MVKLGTLHLRPFMCWLNAELSAILQKHVSVVTRAGVHAMRHWSCSGPARREHSLTSAYQHSWKTVVLLVLQDFQDVLKWSHVLVQTNTTVVFYINNQRGIKWQALLRWQTSSGSGQIHTCYLWKLHTYQADTIRCKVSQHGRNWKICKNIIPQIWNTFSKNGSQFICKQMTHCPVWYMDRAEIAWDKKCWSNNWPNLQMHAFPLRSTLWMTVQHIEQTMEPVLLIALF